MKVHQFPRAIWDHVQPEAVNESFGPAAVVRKRLRSLAPRTSEMDDNNVSFSVVASYDIKSFIRPESSPRKLSPASFNSENISCSNRDNNNPSAPAQVETANPGGTRWNPTQEQIGILEMLYKGGMRTPNAPQIEHIAEKLAKYGKIEGKNVFYWFQNHKARERQKQKRERVATHSHYHATSLSPPSSAELATARNTITSMLANSDIVAKDYHHINGLSDGAHKRRCRSWTIDHSTDKDLSNEKECNYGIETRSCRSEDEVSVRKTLQLFPLHPEGKR